LNHYIKMFMDLLFVNPSIHRNKAKARHWGERSVELMPKSQPDCSACLQWAGLVDVSAQRHTCVSARRRGFPSHDYSWFGFIGSFELIKFVIIRATSMPTMNLISNRLIFKDFFE